MTSLSNVLIPIQEIDESHPIFGSKYLKNKQVKDLLQDQYLKLVQAEKDKLITMTMSIDMAQGTRLVLHILYL